MGARLRRIGGEAAKFSAVNVVATLVAIMLFNLLVHGVKGLYDGPMNQRPLSAYLLANCVGMGISFYGSSRYAFKHRRPTGPAGGALNYVAVNLLSFAIPISCLWTTRNVFGWDSALADNVSGNVVGALLGMLFRFWAFRTFVFRRQPKHGKHESALFPEVRPHEAELVEHQPQERQAEAHDVVGVAGHARHERAPEAVESERARHD